MNFTSFLANKCFEYLLRCDAGQEKEDSCALRHTDTRGSCTSQFNCFPPWAIEQDIFKKLCNGCGECLPHCENQILELSKKGYPIVNFSKGACSFCGACARNCPQGALRFSDESPAWNIYASINRNCLMHNRVLCSTCVEKCEKGAIVLSSTGTAVPEILAEKCDGCGVCIGSCPVGSIVIKTKKLQTKS